MQEVQEQHTCPLKQYRQKMMESSLRTRRLNRAKRLAEEASSIFARYNEDVASLVQIVENYTPASSPVQGVEE